MSLPGPRPYECCFSASATVREAQIAETILN